MNCLSLWTCKRLPLAYMGGSQSVLRFNYGIIKPIFCLCFVIFDPCFISPSPLQASTGLILLPSTLRVLMTVGTFALFSGIYPVLEKSFTLSRCSVNIC